MNVRLFIARRYLFARKSHNVINVISAISAIGMAIGTAALVLILSVYNGFDDLIRRNIGDLAPDLLMASPTGSAKFTPDSLLIDALAADQRVESVRYTLEDNVFLTYGDRQSIARAKGVEDGFEESEKILRQEFCLADIEKQVDHASICALCTLPGIGVNSSVTAFAQIYSTATDSRTRSR